MSTILLRSVIACSWCGAAGLVDRKVWAVSLVLLPVGAYLLLRTIDPPDGGLEGIGGLYRLYLEQLGTGATEYAARFFPLDLAGAPVAPTAGLQRDCLTGVASFLALSLRRPVPGVTVVLVLIGFSFTVDNVPRMVGLAVALPRPRRLSAGPRPQP